MDERDELRQRKGLLISIAKWCALITAVGGVLSLGAVVVSYPQGFARAAVAEVHERRLTAVEAQQNADRSMHAEMRQDMQHVCVTVDAMRDDIAEIKAQLKRGRK